MRFVQFRIKSKIISIVLLVSTLSLILAVSGFYLINRSDLRSGLAHESMTLLTILAQNCTAPLAFRDEKALESILASLNEVSRIDAVVVVDENGEVFSTYLRNGIVDDPP